MGQKDRLHAENGGFRNGTQQDLNKMVDMVKLRGGGGKKIVQLSKMGGKTAAHPYWLSKSPPPGMIWGRPIPNTRASQHESIHDFSVVIQIRWKYHVVQIRDWLKWSLWNVAHGTAVVQNFVAIWFPTMKLHLKSSFHRIKIRMGKSFMNWAPWSSSQYKDVILQVDLYTWVLWYWYRIFIMEIPIGPTWKMT